MKRDARREQVAVRREEKIRKLRERRKEECVDDGNGKPFSFPIQHPFIYRVVIVISYASTLVHRFELLRIRINGNLSRNIFHHVSHLLTNGLLNADYRTRVFDQNF